MYACVGRENSVADLSLSLSLVRRVRGNFSAGAHSRTHPLGLVTRDRLARARRGSGVRPSFCHQRVARSLAPTLLPSLRVFRSLTPSAVLSGYLSFFLARSLCHPLTSLSSPFLLAAISFSHLPSLLSTRSLFRHAHPTLPLSCTATRRYVRRWPDDREIVHQQGAAAAALSLSLSENVLGEGCAALQHTRGESRDDARPGSTVGLMIDRLLSLARAGTSGSSSERYRRSFVVPLSPLRVRHCVLLRARRDVRCEDDAHSLFVAGDNAPDVAQADDQSSCSFDSLCASHQRQKPCSFSLSPLRSRDRTTRRPSPSREGNYGLYTHRPAAPHRSTVR